MTTPKTKTTKKTTPAKLTTEVRLSYLEACSQSLGADIFDLADQLERLHSEAKGVAWVSLAACFISGAAIVTSFIR